MNKEQKINNADVTVINVKDKSCEVVFWRNDICYDSILHTLNYIILL